MDNYKAFYTFVKNVVQDATAGVQAGDKIEKVKSAIALMEIELSGDEAKE